MDTLVFTPAALLDLFSQIDELSGYEISLTETIDKKLQLQIGDSVYIVGEDAELVSADRDVVSDIDKLNSEAYDELTASDDFTSDQHILSGIVAELAKTLFIGGVARLTSKYLKN